MCRYTSFCNLLCSLSSGSKASEKNILLYLDHFNKNRIKYKIVFYNCTFFLNSIKYKMKLM